MGLRAGAASRDITPELRGDFFGYVRPDLRARGVALRLQAHALVLDDGTRRIGLLTLDLGAPLVTDAILARVADLGFDASNLLVSATHTHAGPNKPGAWVAAQAADALRAAHAALTPARAGWGSATVDDANHNRSLEAHLANHGLDLYPGTGALHLDPAGEDHPRDLTLRLLRVEADDGRPLAAWAHFSVHPTTFVPANRTFSADFPAVATWRFRAAFDGPAPVAVLANGTEGDLIPRYDACNQHAVADLIGQRVAAAMQRAWDGATPVGDVTVAGAVERIRYRGQEVAPGKRVGDRAWFGLPFLGGAENGPSFLFGLGLQGTRRPRWRAGPVHGRKIVAAPAPWPTSADVTVLRVGDRLLLAVPGEPTVEMGRRSCAAALEVAGPEVGDALIVGLAQAYRGYFTTPEEYDQQHYEGGHTVFGRYTSLLLQQAHVTLAARLADTLPAPPVPTGSGPPPAVPAPVGTRRRRVRITRQPPERAERFATVTFGWRAARRGRGRPVGAPLLTLERSVAGRWEPVEDDLGPGFLWMQHGADARARYELPADLPTGTYRFTVHGGREPVSTRSVEVTPSTRLRPLDAVVEDGQLVVRAQHPPPDPQRCLRVRDRSPAGGQLRCRVGSRELTATWDADRRGWVAPLPPDAGTVHVPAGGLVDGLGNRSGTAVDLVVGEVVAPHWPAHLGPGGGRSPGPFALGPAGHPPPFDPDAAT